MRTPVITYDPKPLVMGPEGKPKGLPPKPEVRTVWPENWDPDKVECIAEVALQHRLRK